MLCKPHHHNIFGALTVFVINWSDYCAMEHCKPIDRILVTLQAQLRSSVFLALEEQESKEVCGLLNCPKLVVSNSVSLLNGVLCCAIDLTTDKFFVHREPILL